MLPALGRAWVWCVCILACTLPVASPSAAAVDCPMGSYFWGGFKGEHFCIRCPGNETSPGCENCNPDPQAQSCSSCSIGQFLEQDHPAKGTGMLRRCSGCPSGKYQEAPGMAECKSCSPGHFNPYSAQIRCELCTSGQFSPAMGSTVCKKCTCSGSNQYPSSNVSATVAGGCSCRNCPAGKYSPAALCRPGHGSNGPC